MFVAEKTIKMTTVTLLTTFVMMTTDTISNSRFEVRDLPYAYDALAPAISEETMRYHHDKHYAGYVSKLNELILDTPYADQPLEDIVMSADGAIFNNAAQAWNHEFFFSSLSPNVAAEPTGELRAAIERDFGSVDELKRQMNNAATSLFGSGWVWLVEGRDGKLEIMAEQNAGTPLTHRKRPLLTLDVWEHAYYIDYRNRRADAVKALWDVVDWKTVERRYERE